MNGTLMVSLKRILERKHEESDRDNHVIVWRITQAKGATNTSKGPEAEMFLAIGGKQKNPVWQVLNDEAHSSKR